MGTKTIGITEGVYERLAAEKRDDESFTDTIARLLDTATTDWRHGFGRYAGAEGDELERFVTDVRRDHAEGLAHRQREVLEAVGFDLDDQGNIRSTPADDE